MSRALDGTYWRTQWRSAEGGQWKTEFEFATKADAKEQCIGNVELHDGEGYEFRIVRIRPRMSIVRAVRLLTEARAKGVELWIRRYDMRGWIKIDRDLPVWATDDFAKPGTHATSMFTAYMLLTRWIVATPEDARRIDARRGS